MNEFSIYSNIDNNDDELMLFKNANDFSMYITAKSISAGTTCCSIIIDYCEDRNIETDDIKKLVSPALREKLLSEMKDSGLIKRNMELTFE